MSTTDALKNYELAIRQQVSQEGREQVSEDRITLLVIRQLVAEYRLDSNGREAELDELRDEDGEPLDGNYAHLDERRFDMALEDSYALDGLLSKLEELLP
ncbi:hypothetical protein SEA_DIANE_61 [Streptomyces phage Diane]|uniref:Uncharacterized protein n=1 Tax=Streptomyces phage Diane TaxID=2041207 RepID=A0A291LIB7_9CAUD|nr:hypothetical protein KGG78_gp61 [Streptomyces phage Diane]ATI18845.1 hypothetical protein SEA_DIANE_61 [Streptomyces phage Diane]